MTNKEAIEKIIADYKFKEKVESGYVYHTEIPFMEAITNIMEDLEILKQYKNIEKELGIDLLTLFKALKNGFYSKSKDGIKFWKEDENHIVFIRHLGYDIEICCEECRNERNAIPTMFLERSTKDYGKTWALTREKLENNKPQHKKTSNKCEKDLRILTKEEYNLLKEWLENE